MLKDLLELDSLKIKNGKRNISKIAKILHKNRNTIRREIKRLKDNDDTFDSDFYALHFELVNMVKHNSSADYKLWQEREWIT